MNDKKKPKQTESTIVLFPKNGPKWSLNQNTFHILGQLFDFFHMVTDTTTATTKKKGTIMTLTDVNK